MRIACDANGRCIRERSSTETSSKQRLDVGYEYQLSTILSLFIVKLTSRTRLFLHVYWGGVFRVIWQSWKVYTLSSFLVVVLCTPLCVIENLVTSQLQSTTVAFENTPPMIEAEYWTAMFLFSSGARYAIALFVPAGWTTDSAT